MIEQVIATVGLAGVVYGAIVTVGILFVVLGAWVGHTDESRKTADNIGRAFDAIGMKHQEAADLMGLTLPQLSRQLAGREPLNAFRLDALPAAFHLAFLRVQSKRHGGAFIEPELMDYLRAAARLGVRRMKSMGLSFNAETRQRA